MIIEHPEMNTYKSPGQACYANLGLQPILAFQIMIVEIFPCFIAKLKP